MARKGLLCTFQPPPGPVAASDFSRMQDNVDAAVETLAADHDVHSAPTVRLATSGAVPLGSAVVVFSGPAGCKLMLPRAAALGAGVGVVTHLVNLATVAVTLIPTGTDTLNGAVSFSLAAGKLAIIVADGVSTWKVATS